MTHVVHSMGLPGIQVMLFLGLTALALAPIHALAAATTITFWHDWSGDTCEIVQALVDQFEAENPGIRVNVEIVSGLGDKLLLAIMGGIAPDVVLLDRWTTASFAARGGMTNLEPFINASGLKAANFFPPTWDEATFQGKPYGIPFNIDTRVLLYHKGLFQEAGLDPAQPPNTWTDLQMNARKGTKRSGDGKLERVGYVPNWGQPNFVHYLWQNSGEIFNKDMTKVTFNTQQGLEVLEWMAEFVDWYGGVAALDAFSGSMNLKGALGTTQARYQVTYDGNWNLGALRRDSPDFYKNDLGAA